MYCSQCGAESPPDCQYCSNCGAPINQSSETITSLQISQPSEPISTPKISFHDSFVETKHRYSQTYLTESREARGREYIWSGLGLAAVFTLPYWGALALFDATPGIFGILFWYWGPVALIGNGIKYYKMSNEKWAIQIQQEEINNKASSEILGYFAVGFLRGYFNNRNNR